MVGEERVVLYIWPSSAKAWADVVHFASGIQIPLAVADGA
jgi:hypothetical protein